MTTLTPADRVRGCLLGGHLGDALGAGIEFLGTLDAIRAKHGPAGVTGLTASYGGVLAACTDDTQMTLFTAEGLIGAARSGSSDVAVEVYRAHLRWLDTQSRRHPPADATGLAAERVLYARRAPGNACLSGLESPDMGTFAQPRNPNSKGCGTVMRSAPFGLVHAHDRARELAEECTVQTHGHPTGIRSTGLFAGLVADLVAGVSLQAAVGRTLDAEGSGIGARETHDALARAVRLAEAATGGPRAEDVAAVGAGWIAEEALAIAVYCALACRGDVVAGLLAAVNHGGDSDSTGAIAGNLLGAAYGSQALPARWVAELEALAVVHRIADDLIDLIDH
ncbi:ADP-ribosylglycohydrolase family protein [Frankia sp. R82]|uniref:ADP-ribosylglycohydrolase family protein n=1 Tax=Frankia sp. R82 TaxID=2950553 RepID=UPI00204302CF|nr:ADP-ribosylglycohydrolase family protein [Frankia sp. R82]MCM3882777.1 ADP-ribosylglycohydrolase family protein [Frankia sp. R82]